LRLFSKYSALSVISSFSRLAIGDSSLAVLPPILLLFISHWYYVFGRRKDEVFLQLKKLLEPFEIKQYCTDGWGAYERHLPAECHEIGKRKTQRIERKHLRLRTRIKRLARKIIYFSKTEEMHDIVIGLFINRYEFGLPV
jgi:insertion element IS1 protein InsB